MHGKTPGERTIAVRRGSVSVLANLSAASAAFTVDPVIDVLLSTDAAVVIVEGEAILPPDSAVIVRAVDHR